MHARSSPPRRQSSRWHTAQDVADAVLVAPTAHGMSRRVGDDHEAARQTGQYVGRRRWSGGRTLVGAAVEGAADGAAEEWRGHHRRRGGRDAWVRPRAAEVQPSAAEGSRGRGECMARTEGRRGQRTMCHEDSERAGRTGASPGVVACGHVRYTTMCAIHTAQLISMTVPARGQTQRLGHSVGLPPEARLFAEEPSWCRGRALRTVPSEGEGRRSRKPTRDMEYASTAAPIPGFRNAGIPVRAAPPIRARRRVGVVSDGQLERSGSNRGAHTIPQWLTKPSVDQIRTSTRIHAVPEAYFAVTVRIPTSTGAGCLGANTGSRVAANKSPRT